MVSETCEHGIRRPWACHECDAIALEERRADTPRTDAGLVERLTIDDTIRFMETACRNWVNFAIKHSDADDMRLALEAFRNQALTEAAARIAALEAEVERKDAALAAHAAVLRDVAALPTIAEMARGEVPNTPIVSVLDRIDCIRQRTETHDAAILAARALGEQP